ncbi:NB-ARC domain-containing protein [Actinoplanes sp. NPDC051861]|uniref:NB-ARC domain-containing protein n=1 Tax=Actinoplanes sp. NPDC051861 TaxID=3155170 RepID=UPI003423D250
MEPLPGHFDLRGAQGVQINAGPGTQGNRWADEQWRRPVLQALSGREVPRPELMDRLVAHVLEPAATTVAMATALRGAGGFGKTTLARMLAHDARVQERFPDGIVWITLGSELNGPDLANEINGVCALLTGAPSALPTPAQAGAELARRIGTRRVLLVLDDVWSRAQVDPFLFAAPGVVRLITTRDSTVLPPATASLPVDAMTAECATALVLGDLPAVGGRLVGDVLDVTGRWPLLLSLVNGAAAADVQAGRGVGESLGEILAALGEAGPTVLDVNEEGRRDRAVEATMAVSLARLTEDERLRYEELAVFGEDVEVPRRVLERYWGSTGGWPAFTAHRFCQRLADLSLATYRQDAPGPRLALHDVIRKYLSHRPARPLRDLHAAFLRAQADLVPSDPEPQWWRLPAEELFLWQWIPAHLAGAGDEERLRSLLLSADFLVRKLEVMNPAAVESDLALLPDAAAQALGRIVRRHAHLLDAVPPDDEWQLPGGTNQQVLATTLATAVIHEPTLQPLREALSALVPPDRRLTVDESVLEPTHPALVRVLTREDDRPTRLRYRPGDGGVTVCFDNSIRLYDRSWWQAQRIWIPEGSATSISGDGTRVAVVPPPDLDAGTVEIYSVESGAVVKRIDGPGPYHRDPLLNFAGDKLALWLDPSEVAVIDVFGDGAPFVFHVHDDYGGHFTPDGSYLVSWSDLELAVLSLASRSIRRFSLPRPPRRCAVTTTPMGRNIAAVCYPGGGIEVFDLDGDGSSAARFGVGLFPLLNFSDDGRWLMACADEHLVLWDMDDLDSPGQTTISSGVGPRAVFSYDGSVISLVADSGISFIECGTGRELARDDRQGYAMAVVPGVDKGLFFVMSSAAVSVWHVQPGSSPTKSEGRQRWALAQCRVA